MPKEVIRCLFYIKAEAADGAIPCLFRSFTSNISEDLYYSVFQIESELDGSFECLLGRNPDQNGEYPIYERTHQNKLSLIGKISPVDEKKNPTCTIFDRNDPDLLSEQDSSSNDPFLQHVLNKRQDEGQPFGLVVLKDELEILN
tara:strand:- start:4631 stop:5062 length:432 start_codon:yes stop_codon:yes gene_type:complete